MNWIKIGMKWELSVLLAQQLAILFGLFLSMQIFVRFVLLSHWLLLIVCYFVFDSMAFCAIS